MERSDECFQKGSASKARGSDGIGGELWCTMVHSGVGRYLFKTGGRCDLLPNSCMANTLTKSCIGTKIGCRCLSRSWTYGSG
jgi:hypothetical protein